VAPRRNLALGLETCGGKKSRARNPESVAAALWAAWEGPGQLSRFA
jgi:hypothetical protein